MKILIGADVCPIGQNETVLSKDAVAEETCALFRNYDLFLANLECPLAQAVQKKKTKTGVSLIGSPETLRGLKRLGINLFSLANNHIMDQGTEGLRSTMNALDKYGIPHFGAGMSEEEAARPFIAEYGDTKIAILAFTEHYFAAVSRKRPGANPLDIPHIVRSFLRLPKDCFKLVILHGGNEHCIIPNPAIRDTARMLVELGAEVVAVQHSHCVCAYERWNDGMIFYGQGNFIFDYEFSSRTRSWMLGFLIDLDIRDNRLVDYRLIPFEQTPGPKIFSLLQGEENRLFLDKLIEYNAILADPERYEKEWDRFCESRRRAFQNTFFGYGKMRSKLNRRFGLVDWFTNSNANKKTGRIFRTLSLLEILKHLYSEEKNDQ